MAEIKTYKFRFSKPVFILACVAILLAVGAAVFAVYRISLYGFATVTLGIQHCLLLLFAALAFVVILSLLIRSVYKITDTHIVLWFGIIKSTYAIADIESVHLFTKTNKLVLYFKDGKYTVVVVKPEWYNEFVKEIIARNDKIRYDVSTSEKEDE